MSQGPQKADHRGNFIMIPRAVLDSVAWRHASMRARVVLQVLLFHHDGWNNGNLSISVKQIGKALNNQNHAANGQALAELIKLGFVECTSGADHGQAKARSGGSNSDLARGAANTGDSINSKLTAIAERLGGMVGDYSVSIGTRSSGWISVSASGSSQVADKGWKKKNAGGDLIYDGKDAEEAARIALLNAVQDGAVKGISQGAQRLLQSGKDLDRQLQRALDFQGVFTSLKGYRDPVAAYRVGANGRSAAEIGLARALARNASPVQTIGAIPAADLTKSMTAAQRGAVATALAKQGVAPAKPKASSSGTGDRVKIVAEALERDPALKGKHARLMSADLIPRRDLIDTPDSVLEMFAPLADKGPAASVRVPTYAGVPDDRSNVGVLAGMRKRMEDMQATR